MATWPSLAHGIALAYVLGMATAIVTAARLAPVVIALLSLLTHTPRV